MTKQFLIGLLALIHFYSVAAQELNFHHYSVDEGLPSSQVHDIIQDKYGNLWFSTDQGLSRYDGYSFKNYTTKDGLTCNQLFKFYRSNNDQIWCTTLSKEIFSITGREPVFKPYPYNKLLKDISEVFTTNCMHISAHNELFMSFINCQGYIHISSKGKVLLNSICIIPERVSQTYLLTEKKSPDFYFMREKNSIHQLSGNWTKTIPSQQQNTGQDYIKACYFEKSNHAIFTKNTEILIRLGDQKPIRIQTNVDPISLGKLDDTHFWVGFRYEGIGIFDLTGKRVAGFFKNKSVTSFFIDHEGGYWFSTLNDGIFHTKNTNVHSYPLDQWENNWINSMAQDGEGKLWIGCYNGNVYSKQGNNTNQVFTSKIKRPALVSYDRFTKQMFFVSDFQLHSVNSLKPVFDEKTGPTSFLMYKNGAVYLGGYSGYLILKPGEPRQIVKTGTRVNDICLHNSIIYLATNKGLYSIIKNNKAKILHPRFVSPQLVITSVKVCNKAIAMGTKGNGVLLIRNNLCFKFNETNGLSNNFVTNVYFENDSVLWACTNKGINRISIKNNKLAGINIVSTSDGLINNEVTCIEIINDTVWIGTRKGLCSVPLSMLVKKNTQPNYFFRINSLKINNNKTVFSAGLKLAYHENKIEFGFKGISFIEFAPLLYRYKLKGLETKWNYSKYLSVVYSSLPPGSYTFIAQAKGLKSYWKQNTCSLSFIIHLPFWKTWWFLIMVIVLMGVLIYLFFRFRILSYNRDITRELMRQVLKRLTKKTNYVVFREQGKDIRIATNTICYVGADGNYIDIHTDTKKYTIRYKIGEFLELVPDPLEYLRISRSYIVRIDKVREKSKKDVTVCGEKIAVGETYLDQLEKIKF